MASQIVSPMIFSCIVYWMVGFQRNGSKFMIFMVFMVLTQLAATSLALMVSAICRTTDLSVTVLPMALEVNRLFGGFFFVTQEPSQVLCMVGCLELCQVYVHSYFTEWVAQINHQMHCIPVRRRGVSHHVGWANNCQSRSWLPHHRFVCHHSHFLHSQYSSYCLPRHPLPQKVGGPNLRSPYCSLSIITDLSRYVKLPCYPTICNWISTSLYSMKIKVIGAYTQGIYCNWVLALEVAS